MLFFISGEHRDLGMLSLFMFVKNEKLLLKNQIKILMEYQ